MYPYQDSALSPEARTKDLLARMTLEEKIGQLNEIPLSRHDLPEIEQEIRVGRVGSLIYATSALAGDEEQFCGGWDDRQRCQRIAVEETRLGIPMINGSNIVHGHRTAGPIPLGQAAAFDPALVEEFAAMSAREAATDGIHWTYAPMVDIARDPRWGRIAEGFGEDPWLAGELGAAAVRGFQGDDPAAPGRIAACCKHYVGYGAAEGGRDYESTEISENTLRNIYLPPFRRCVEAGAAIAEVLAGRAEPAGRLPVTLPRHSGQIPLYYNHKSNGRAIDEYYGDVEFPNYVDMPGSPLYPFGYGLSYTRFAFDSFRCEAADGAVEAAIRVRNTGNRPGYAVVQCYVQDQVASVTLPVRQLKGFRKLFLQPGEERVASFRLTREDLSFYDARGRLRFEPGRFTLWLGQDCQHGLQATFTLA